MSNDSEDWESLIADQPEKKKEKTEIKNIESEEAKIEVIEEEKKLKPIESKPRINLNKNFKEITSKLAEINENFENIVVKSITKNNEVIYNFEKTISSQNQEQTELIKIVIDELKDLKKQIKEQIPIVNPVLKIDLEKEIVFSFIRNYLILPKNKKQNKWIPRLITEIARDLRIIENNEFTLIIENMKKNQLLKIVTNKNRLLITKKSLEKYKKEIESIFEKSIDELIATIP